MRGLLCCLILAAPLGAQTPLAAGVSVGSAKLNDQRSERVLSGVVQWQTTPWLSLSVLPSFVHVSDSAKAGSVSISFTNSSSVPHNLTVGSSSGAVLGATPTFQGGTKILPLHLAAGTYKFYCTVPGHRQAGMEGTLTVQ